MEEVASMIHPDGLRERKKQRTRLALVDAALDLFLTHGYDRTTVDQIAAVVDVSPRTFFRYFASKEDILLHTLEDGERLLTSELASRPADEPPFVALSHAYSALFRHLADVASADHDRFDRTERVLSAEPALKAVIFNRVVAMEDRCAAELARRMRTGPDDPRPRMAVALLGAVTRTGLNCPKQHKGDIVGADRRVEDALALAGQMLRYDWTGEPADRAADAASEER
jgi:AcrR family transcriptional regulator